MDLKTLILPSKEVDFEYEGVEGLVFTLAYMSKSTLEDMRKTNTKMSKNKYTKQYEENLDQESFLKEYVPAVLTGWKGLNTDNLQTFVATGGVEGDPTDVEYSEENAYTLLTNASDLDNWVSDKIGEVENFRENK